MSALTEADICAGQLWRDPGTPHLWQVHSVTRDRLIGDLFETTVVLVGDFDPRETLRIPGAVLLAGYELEKRL